MSTKKPNKKTREAIAETRMKYKTLDIPREHYKFIAFHGREAYMDMISILIQESAARAATSRKPVPMVRVGWMVKGKFKGAKTWDVGFHTVRELAIENLRTEVLYAPDGSWGDEWYVQGPITAIYARKEGSKK